MVYRAMSAFFVVLFIVPSLSLPILPKTENLVPREPEATRSHIVPQDPHNAPEEVFARSANRGDTSPLHPAGSNPGPGQPPHDTHTMHHQNSVSFISRNENGVNRTNHYALYVSDDDWEQHYLTWRVVGPHPLAMTYHTLLVPEAPPGHLASITTHVDTPTGHVEVTRHGNGRSVEVQNPNALWSTVVVRDREGAVQCVDFRYTVPDGPTYIAARWFPSGWLVHLPEFAEPPPGPSPSRPLAPHPDMGLLRPHRNHLVPEDHRNPP